MPKFLLMAPIFVLRCVIVRLLREFRRPRYGDFLKDFPSVSHEKR
jgi:hypothetical protein